jgi:hypothetical protein
MISSACSRLEPRSWTGGTIATDRTDKRLALAALSLDLALPVGSGRRHGGMGRTGLVAGQAVASGGRRS